MLEPHDVLKHFVYLHDGAPFSEDLPPVNEMIEEYEWYFGYPIWPQEEDPFPVFYELLAEEYKRFCDPDRKK